VWGTALLLWVAACGTWARDGTPEEPGGAATDPDAAGEPAPAEAGAEAEPGATPEPGTSAAAEPASAQRTVWTAAEALPDAELLAPGLRIDLGAGTHHAYTLGGWRTRWGADGLDDGRTVTAATGSPVRLYVPADAVRGRAMRVLLRTVGGRKVTAEVEGTRLGEQTASTAGYAAVVFDVPAELEGQVTVKLSFRGSGPVEGFGRVAALVDRIDFVEAGDDAETTPEPEREADGAILQRAGTTLRFHLPVPPGARLVLAPSAPSPTAVKVTATFDGRAPAVLLDETIGPEGGEREADLSSFAGEAMRLAWEAAAGEGTVRWAGGRVEVPRSGAEAPPPRAARNLVIVLVDTLRADKLRSIAPSSAVHAEALEAWGGEEGVTFLGATAPENWTKPSVASLLSGLHPTEHTAKSDRSMLPDEVELLSERLRGQGFATGCFIANGYVSDAFGFRQGWDTYRNYVRAGLPNRAQHVFEEATAWLRERSPDERFFLYIHTIDPHVPYIPPREFLEMYDPEPYAGPVRPTETAKLLEQVKGGRVRLGERDRARLQALYDGEISYHDAHLVRLRAALSDMGALDRTVVVVTADHGEEFFDHGSVGHGHSLYEELIHVPLFVRAPESLPGGTRVAARVSLVDVVPTVLDLLGLPPVAELPGRSLVPLAWEGATGMEVAFGEFLEGQRAAVGSRYKLIQRGYSPVLFDLSEDPEELRSVAALRPVALRTMATALSRHLATLEGRDRPRPRIRPAPDAGIDDELEQQLRALGYMGGPE
jgi:arylsulfatase A-like enzyme